MTSIRFLSRRPSLVAFASSALLLAGCIIGDKDTPGGSEVENEYTARIFLAGGGPAANASVKVYPVDHNPQGAPKVSAAQALIYSTRTDSKGGYTLDSLPRGEYNILSEKDGELAYQDSVFIAGTEGSIASDTLDEPGSLMGRIKLQPDHDPRTVTIQLLGTNTFVNVDEEGRFALENLAQGIYRARVVTTEDGYTPLYREIRIRSGRNDSLDKPILLTFTGIPVVENLTVAYDTVTGVARLHWNPVKYQAFDEYLVFRNDASELEPMLVQIARLKDTVFHDTLFPMDLLAEWGSLPMENRLAILDGSAGRLEYRVAVRNKSRGVGLAYGSAVLDAVNPLMVRTHTEITKQGLIDNVASIGDTVSFRLAYANPLFRNALIRWYVSGQAQPVRETGVAGFSGLDILRFRWDAASRPKVRIVIRDEAGREWVDSTYLEIVAPVPSLDAGPRQELSIGDTVRLQGEAWDKFGKIVKWEWDIGGTGRFAESPGPDTRFLAPGMPARIPCVLRVTNEDGVSNSDVVLIEVVRDLPEVSVSDAAAFPGDTLRLTGKVSDGYGRIVAYAWDIGNTGTFTPASGPDTLITVPTGSGTAAYVLRATDDDGNQSSDTLRIARIPDPAFASIPSGNFPIRGNPMFFHAFRIMPTEVTLGLFHAVMGGVPGGKVVDWDLPKAYVTLGEAMEFCNRLGKRMGFDPVYTITGTDSWSEEVDGGIRLPTYNQWEYAARAGNTATFWEDPNPDQIAWYEGNSGGKAHPVALKKPNDFGLFDMAGNVSEYVRVDYFGSRQYYSIGSSWNASYDRNSQIMSFMRGPTYPVFRGEKDVGFRVVLPP